MSLRRAITIAILASACSAERSATRTLDAPAPLAATMLTGATVNATPVCSAEGASVAVVEGRVVPVGSAASAPVGPHGAFGGRLLRMLSVDQFHVALVAATGFTWEAARRVPAPDAPLGYVDDPRADMIAALGSTLGKPDYAASSTESREPSITFTKIAGDAARSACRESVAWDAGRPREERRILRFVERNDTLASNPHAVRDNARYLALRFWSRVLDPDGAELAPLLTLFDHATRAGTPDDGWRAVCIALATDPQFMTY